jgi:glycosyltransferase involved in cell wall biosynthesis
MRILSLSTVFPSPANPVFGTFVCSRLQHLAAMPDVSLRVAAPVPVLDYANYRRRFFRLWDVPWHGLEGNLPVVRPRWIYPPIAGGSNGLLLGIELAPYLALLRRSFRFELIDAHFAYPEGVAAAILSTIFRCPFTITLRGNEVDHLRSWIKRKWMRWALSRASRVFAVSGRLRAFAVSNGAAASRTLVVPNGIDPSLFHPRDRQEMRRRHAIAPADLLVVSAGNLIELKGHHRVVRAVKAARDQGLAARLVVVGGGPNAPFAAGIRRTVDEAGMAEHVHFAGRVGAETMAEWMSAADVLCLASDREGWPNVVHEALACGTPVVATDVGGVPDLIPASDFGIVVPPGDQASLDQAVCEALTRSWNHDAIAAWGMSRTWTAVAADVFREWSAVLEEPIA